MPVISNEARNLNQHMVARGIEASPADYVASLSDDDLGAILYPLAGEWFGEIDPVKVTAFRSRASQLRRYKRTVASDNPDLAGDYWEIEE